MDATKNSKVNFAINNGDSQFGQSDEDDLIKDVTNGFNAVEKTGPPIGKNWLT